MVLDERRLGRDVMAKVKTKTKTKKKTTKAKVGNNLELLSLSKRRAIWTMRKQAYKRKACPPGKEAHHPNYNRPDLIMCVTREEHRKLPHKW